MLGEFIRAVSDLISLIAGFAGVIAVACFIYGAYKYMSASGSPAQVDDAKRAMVYSFVGLFLVLVSFTIVNTVIAVVGSSAAAIRIPQVVGVDSENVEPPQVVHVEAYGKTTGSHPKTKGVRVVFSKPVIAQGKVRIYAGRYGMGDLITSQGSVAPILEFKHPDGLKVGCSKLDVKEYPVEEILLASGGSIADEYGLPALYAFQPTPVEHCLP